MKLAILGGSFNPVHSGHLYLADTVLAELGYGRVILIPALISPLKRDADAAPARDRLDMILAAAAACPRLGVDDTEIQRGGVSFTIDTVDDIIERCRPEGKPGLIIGDDLAADFPRWKNAGELAEKTDIIIARRMWGEVSPLAPNAGGVLRDPPLRGAPDSHSAPQRPAFPFPHINLQNAVLPVSSALIRERIASGGAWRSLVPQGARCIIEERGLYGCPKPQPDAEGGKETEKTGQTGQTSSGDQVSLILALENAARAALKPSRFLHSRNTALVSCDLARRFGLDSRAAYLAGISHDLGKALDDGDLLALAKRDGKPFSALERKKPKLLHGRAAAVLLRERFGIHNKEVLEAVACHTSGKRGMGPLAQAVYIADKIEYSRRGVDSRFRERAAGAEGEGLGALFYAVLADNIRYLEERGIPVAEETRKLKAKLEKERDREIRQ